MNIKKAWIFIVGYIAIILLGVPLSIYIRDMFHDEVITAPGPHYISVKYGEDPVDVSNFETFDTSKSSFIEEAYYDIYNEYLILNLTGTYYHWCGVPSYIWEEFKESDSLGGYFNKYIKGEYACRDLKAEEEAARKAEEGRIAKEQAEKAELERQMAIQQQQVAAKKQMCDNLIAEANRKIAEIEAQKSTHFCNNLNQQYEKVKQLENKIKNVSSEAKAQFQGDAPGYIISAYAANKREEYQDQIDSTYYMINNFNIYECREEQMNNRKFDELILQRKAMIVEKGC